jgi:hypothetical protein
LISGKSGHMANIIPQAQLHEKLFQEAVKNNDYVNGKQLLQTKQLYWELILTFSRTAMKYQQELIDNSLKMRKHFPTMTVLPLINVNLSNQFNFFNRTINHNLNLFLSLQRRQFFRVFFSRYVQ